MKFDIFYKDENSGKMKERKDIPFEFTWDLTHIFPDIGAWKNEFDSVKEALPKITDYKGKIGTGAETLAECLKFVESLSMRIEKLYLYAFLSKDTDLRENENRSRYELIVNLYTNFGAASSFVTPEILECDPKIIEESVNKCGLNYYQHYFDDIKRQKLHTLPANEEKLLAMSGEITQLPYNTFSIFTDADIKFPKVKDENGKLTEISHGRYYAALYSPDREFRKRAFKAYYKPFLNYSNTYSTLFNGNLKSKIFYAKARNYSSALEASLDKNNISTEVYHNLIKNVTENLAPMHRWADIKRKVLKLDKINPYDSYVTLFETKGIKEYPYKEALKIVEDSLSPMGVEYLDALRTAFNNRWIDVYETTGKRSGAYSSGVSYGAHPYVLLNYTGLLNDVFTLTHEMGHNMHSFFTEKYQPYIYANYSIFLAEVASTFNESLLLDHLISISEDKKTRLALLEKYLNNVTATFYRQTMFAEFELEVYTRTENGEALNPKTLCDLYGSIYQKYWGDAMSVDKEEHYTWARVPHFYYNFYVYQYATGMAASELLASKVLTEKEPAIERYLSFLKAGESKYPLEVLQTAGVDMTKPDAVLAVVKKMNNILDLLEKEL